MAGRPKAGFFVGLVAVAEWKFSLSQSKIAD